MMFRLIVLLALFVALSDALGFQQSAAVRGTITCNGEPAQVKFLKVIRLKIKLVDHDTFTKSDKMSEGITQNDGSFFLSGHKSEITSIVPELRIYHRCNRNVLKFWRGCSKIRIPPSYVFKSAAPEQTFDAGTLRLDTMATNC
ncbi:putative effector protein [Aphelenchoides besseyi]|nr:putative effector protein [Aphelenchoides besseyi]KAI6218813.1 putative effector protein [Aphelenchoides besseyi]